MGGMGKLPRLPYGLVIVCSIAICLCVKTPYSRFRTLQQPFCSNQSINAHSLPYLTAPRLCVQSLKPIIYCTAWFHCIIIMQCLLVNFCSMNDLISLHFLHCYEYQFYLFFLCFWPDMDFSSYFVIAIIQQFFHSLCFKEGIIYALLDSTVFFFISGFVVHH